MPSSILNSDDGVISGTSGLKSSGGDDGVLVFQSKGTETARINTDKQIVAAAGTASLPALTTTGDVNTGIFFPAADTIAFAEGGAEAMRIDSSGNVGIGTTSVQPFKVHASRGSMGSYPTWETTVARNIGLFETDNGEGYVAIGAPTNGYSQISFADPGSKAAGAIGYAHATDHMLFRTNATERARIDSSGNLLVGTTNTNPVGADINGIALVPGGRVAFSRLGGEVLGINRGTDDGTLVSFAQAGSTEGSISVSGSTVSYNGGHLSRWAQMLTKPDLLKGTVMSNLDEMNVYVDADGNPVENEQLNKVKVSDIEGDANVAGVFVNWTYDEAHQVDEINMAMTGDMIIRIAEGVTVARGDLLMSAGDGTAKPQGDDIVRSKTIAKVTSTHVTCTYDDGSYCVPCVLMAC